MGGLLVSAVLGSLIVCYWRTQWEGMALLVSHLAFRVGVATTALSMPMAFLAVRIAERPWNRA